MTLLVNMCIKFSSFKIIPVGLTSCLTVSSETIDDLIIAFGAHYTFRKNRFKLSGKNVCTKPA